MPSISKLLLATGQLSNSNTASKRAADTAVLMIETTLNTRSSPRMFDSIARINYLHGRYRRSGQISNDDMLYTLSLFALEPSRWAANLDWRAFSEVELCAEGVLWKDIGEAMKIEFDVLEGDIKGKDGAAWLRALERWSLGYEEKASVPDERNKKVAMGTLDILLINIPRVAKSFFTGVATAVLDERTRTSMMYA
ncbi:DUF2236 domain-containing protein, partial [Candidatus Bathyarchaeota archaeon]|nr:DUF2236 domain-containing protein [Candidatus Bathyarchaeota archaeon]